jgi:FkbM family methyltransferase
VGANDGFNQDPIHRYIRRDAWKGILLEPLKDVYTNYLEKLYRKNKNVITLNAAIDTRDGELPIYRISFSDARWATGLTSFRKEVILNAIHSGYVKKKAQKQGVQIPDKTDDYIKEEKVECISFGSLLDRYHVAKINWLQIDTEGYDFEIIKMFDFEKMKPEVIVYEHFHLSEEDLMQCEIFLNSNNYLTKKNGVNTIAILSTLNKNLLDMFHSLN